MTALPPGGGGEPERSSDGAPEPSGSTPDPTTGASPSGPELPRWARSGAPRGSNPLTEERLAAYIGSKWEGTYRRKLAPFLEDPAFVPTWNWSAALSQLLLPSAWFLYRKLYLPFAIFFLVPGVALRLLTNATVPSSMAELLKPENQWLLSMMGAVNLSSALAAGGTANWFLYRRARAATTFVTAQALGPGEETALMRRLGGVNRLATALFVTLTLVLTMGSIGA